MYHLLLQMNAGGQPRQPAPITNRIQNRIETLNDRFKGGKITVDELLDGLSQLVVSQKKMNALIRSASVLFLATVQ